jgi:hypothetical protein
VANHPPLLFTAAISRASTPAAGQQPVTVRGGLLAATAVQPPAPALAAPGPATLTELASEDRQAFQQRALAAFAAAGRCYAPDRMVQPLRLLRLARLGDDALKVSLSLSLRMSCTCRLLTSRCASNQCRVRKQQ